MIKRTALHAALLMLAALSPARAIADWIPIDERLEKHGYGHDRTRNGVNVFRLRRAKIIRIAAEGKFPLPPKRVQRALLLYDKHAQSLRRLAESRILKRTASALWVYQRLKLPVISDRDTVLRVDWGHKGYVWWVKWRTDSHNKLAPATPGGVVRLAINSGSWQLKSMGRGGQTWARYMLKMDLGGLVPSWMARSGSAKEVPDLFRVICRMAGGGSQC